MTETAAPSSEISPLPQPSKTKKSRVWVMGVSTLLVGLAAAGVSLIWFSDLGPARSSFLRGGMGDFPHKGPRDGDGRMAPWVDPMPAQVPLTDAPVLPSAPPSVTIPALLTAADVPPPAAPAPVVIPPPVSVAPSLTPSSTPLGALPAAAANGGTAVLPSTRGASSEPVVIPPPVTPSVVPLGGGIAEGAIVPVTPVTPVTDTEARLTALSQRLDQIQQTQQLQTLQGNTAGGVPVADPAQSRRLDDLNAQLQSLQNQMSNIAAQAAKAGSDADRLRQDMIPTTQSLQTVTQELQNLKNRLETVSTTVDTVRRDGARAQAFVLGVGQLRNAIEGGRPYDAALQTVRGLTLDDAEMTNMLSRLDPQAAKGIPSRYDLMVQFSVLAPQIVAASDTQVNAGWMQTTWKRMASVVTVRKTGADVTGSDVEARVARAEARLKQGGDMLPVITELAPITGAPAVVLAPWLADARARMEGEQTIKALTDRALARLAAVEAQTVAGQRP